MKTTARDWFATAFGFRQLCGDAQSQARGESSQEFAAQIMIAANRNGLDADLSVKQLEWLCRLADWDVPTRIQR